MIKRLNKINLRLSDKELEDLNSKVYSSGMSREGYLREMIIRSNVKALPPVDYGKLISETRRIGYNLNQLLALANSNKVIDLPQFRQCRDEIFDLSHKIYEAFFESELI